jgi:TolA-binding protein
MAHLRASPIFSVLVGLVILGAWASPGAALEEADRLFLVGEKAFDDGLYPLSRRMLERFVERFSSDRRAGEATLLLGKARLSQGAGEAALEAFKKAESFQPPPGKPGELRFWEAEAFYRLKRFSDARTAYADVISGGAAGPRVADALYGLGWAELEAKRREPAAAAFQRLVSEFPDHALAPTATSSSGPRMPRGCCRPS